MWNIKYKLNNNPQAWSILDSYDNKTSAYSKASRVMADYFMVKVIDTNVAEIRERQRRERKEQLYSYHP